MAPGWRGRTLLDLLAAHDLDRSPQLDFPNDGWSGATFHTLTDPAGRRFVLKRTSLAQDWIARATRDDELREGWLASVAREALSMLYLGAAADGDGVALLMPDLSTELIAWERPGHDPLIDDATLARVITSMARLHTRPWHDEVETIARRDDSSTPPWCPLPERLTLLARPSAAVLADAGNAIGDRFLSGWDAFDRLAPASARDLITRLGKDPAPLVKALAQLPAVGLHGDLKLANIALLADDRVGFIDWQMTLRAPVAVELGWFLVANSGSLPTDPDGVLDAYSRALAGTAGDWDVQRDLTWIVGLLLRGWRKGLDAEADARLGSGASARDDLAWWCQRAVDAAYRRM